MKHYCMHCKHYSRLNYNCIAGSNWKLIKYPACYLHEAYEEWHYVYGNHVCAEKNANYDCPDYEEVKKQPWWKFWR